MVHRVEGKSIYDNLTELIMPEHTALVIVDMQNDFCSPKGLLAGSAKDLSLVRSSVRPQVRLAQLADRVGAMVIYVKNTTEPGCASDSPAHLYFKLRSMRHLQDSSYISTCEYTVEDTWGQEIIDELRDTVQKALVTRKDRLSAFVNTSLSLLLRSNNIETVIVTGFCTEGAVASTARDAQMYDFYCVVPQDCVGSYSQELHNAALKVMESRCDVKESDEILKIWNKFNDKLNRDSDNRECGG